VGEEGGSGRTNRSCRSWRFRCWRASCISTSVSTRFSKKEEEELRDLQPRANALLSRARRHSSRDIEVRLLVVNTVRLDGENGEIVHRNFRDVVDLCKNTTVSQCVQSGGKEPGQRTSAIPRAQPAIKERSSSSASGSPAWCAPTFPGQASRSEPGTVGETP
jgi:hypothetical protein